MALSCEEVNWIGIEGYLLEVETRLAATHCGGNVAFVQAARANPGDLSSAAHLLAIDVPRLIDLLRQRR